MKHICYFLIVFGFFSCGNKEKVIKAEKKLLIEAVYASGNIAPKNEYKVYALADGTIQQRLVNEGDEVKRNQMLFRIESDIQNAKLESARTNFSIAQQNLGQNSPILNEASIALQNATMKFEQDSVNYIRYKNVFESNAMTASEFDKVKLAYQISRNDLHAKKETYRKIRNQVLAEYQNAESQYKINTKDESNYLIGSQIDGIVYKIFPEQGEFVRRSEVLAILGNKKDFYLKLNVDETDIAKIKVGQEVLIKIDIFKEQIFKAKISKIYPQINGTEQSFRVDAEFEGQTPITLSGLSVEANIIIQRKESVWAIPKKILVGQDSVWVKRNGKTEKIKIQKGIENYDFVEIMGNVNENTTFIQK